MECSNREKEVEIADLRAKLECLSKNEVASVCINLTNVKYLRCFISVIMQVELTSKCSEMDRLREKISKLQESLTSELSKSTTLQDKVHTDSFASDENLSLAMCCVLMVVYIQLTEVGSQLATKTKELSDLEDKHKKETSNAAQESEDAKKAYDAHVRPP